MRAGAPDEPVSATDAAALFADPSDAPVLILAVSGGPDSTALMWLAARWRAGAKHGPTLIAVTVDQGLREESAHEALAVKRLAKKFGIEHRTLRWTGRKPKTGIQEAARNARYRLLADAARKAGASHILAAHTLDDQAETVLFRLARGSGVSGLRGMARVTSLPSSRGAAKRRARNPYPRIGVMDSGPGPEPVIGPAVGRTRWGRPGMTDCCLIRPLLSLPKSRLLATLRAAKIAFADDPSNRDPRFTRPRLRHLMPGLAAEGLDARRLASLARRMARADQAIEHAADAAGARLSRGAGPIVFSRQYADLPAEVGLRLLGRAIAQLGDEGPVELAKLEALYDALAAAMAQRPPAARFRRTLAGALVTFAGEITVECAPARRSGARVGTKRRKGAFTKAR